MNETTSTTKRITTDDVLEFVTVGIIAVNGGAMIGMVLACCIATHAGRRQ